MSIIVIGAEEDREREKLLCQRYDEIMSSPLDPDPLNPRVVVESTCPTCGQKRYTVPATMAKGVTTP